MSWSDFLYFSKGERRAFAVILLLIALSGGLFILIDKPPAKDENVEADAAPDTVRAETAVVQPPPAEKKTHETTRERVKRLTTPVRSTDRQSKKLAAGSTVELNMADTLALQKVPGIGRVYSNRIVKFRNLLGGFYHIEQLSEVYGIDEETYARIAPWFRLDTSLIRRLPVNELPADSLRRHPYISPRQAYAIERLRKQKKHLAGWENLQLLKEFTEFDKARLEPYLSFE
ncbi:MAG: helix-hairpin-helix domain-containing protein [Tannerella sp.]|jgi:DNA uptake protein ComE-like DNA-binding protein|nr:helix-hairpin-helix domain-containing protein [Tannerella sp.]